MPIQWINLFGLVLDISGAYILFWKAYPQPSFEEGVGLDLEDGTLLTNGLTVAEYSQKTREEKERYKRVSQCGLALLIFGFILQARANLVSILASLAP